MYRLFIIGLFLGGLYLLYQRGHETPPPPPPPPPALNAVPTPVLSKEEIEKIRLSTKDSDSAVRWAAIEFLYRIHDPMAFEALENTLAIDTEPGVRHNALNLLKTSDNPNVTKDLERALKDSEKDIRLAALAALGDLGDISTAPAIVDMMRDVEPDIRLQAIHTLGRIQEKRFQEYKEQQELLRAEYEKALRRSQGPQPLSGGGNIFDRTKIR